MREELALNSDTPWPSVEDARCRVLGIQRKLHRWTTTDREKRFDDLFNLVYDRATLIVAWDRIRSNRGSRTAGVDGVTRWHIEHRLGKERFLEELRSSLKTRTFKPCPVKEQGIPKAGGKTRYLGIPTMRDRVVQMALKLVVEPIYEADFYPASYGYRPARRAQDAIAEIVHFIMPPSSYEFIVEGDIKACFDNVHHGILMTLLRQRIEDRKVLALIRAFLMAGVLKETGRLESTVTGTPQGGIISPLLANVYLSSLDRHFERAWQSQTRTVGYSTRLRRQGQATYRLVRYADDFVILVRGTREQAEDVRAEAAHILAQELRMELSEEKTLVTHVDDGFDFLGHRICRRPWNGKKVAWTFPSKKSVEAIKHKVKHLTTRSTTYHSLRALLLRLNPILRGWATYFRYDASKRTLAYIDHFAWRRVYRWLRKKHPKRTWRYLKQRYCGGHWHIEMDGTELFRPSKIRVERYRYRGTKILLPWMDNEELGHVGRFARSLYDESAVLGALEEQLAVGHSSSLVESRMRGDVHVRFGGRERGNRARET
jgi:RNA-directed DNA polymerase